MPTPLPNLIFASGDHSTAQACDLPIFRERFPGVNIDYVFTQDFIQALADYIPLELNTAHPDYAQFILVEEGAQTDLGGGRVKWQRKYAKVPATHSQPQTMNYNFIGYFGTSGINVPTAVGRLRLQYTVAARVQYDYFLLDKASGNITDASGAVVYDGPDGTLPPLDRVPILLPQEYYGASVYSVQNKIVIDEIAYSQNALAPAVPQILYPTPDGTSARPPLDAYPTREIYEKWIARTLTVKTYNPATNTLTDTGLYEIVAQPSSLARWLGNIIERQTVYIRPA
jgi:hypothetical protein